MPRLNLLLADAPAALFALSIIKASILLAAAQLLVAGAPRLSASFRHVILTAGVLGFVFIPLAAVLAPPWSIAVLPAPVEPSITRDAVGAIDSGPVAAPTGMTLRHVPAEKSRIDFNAAAGAIWVLGILALAGRFTGCALRLRRIAREASDASPRIQHIAAAVHRALGSTAPVRALISKRIAVPMIWGIRSGTLLLPCAAEQWSEEQLRATLLHELGHLRRFDYLTLAAMNLVTATLWFHPQLWIARRRALIEAERACDDLVLGAGARASEYASHLLQVARGAEPREPLAAVLAMARPSQLEGRLQAVLSPTINRRSITRKVFMLTTVAFLALTVPFAAVQLSAEPPASPAPAAAVESVAPVARVAEPTTPRPPAAAHTPTVTPKAPQTPRAAPAALAAPLALPAPLNTIGPAPARPEAAPVPPTPLVATPRPLAPLAGVPAVAPEAPLPAAPEVPPSPAPRAAPQPSARDSARPGTPAPPGRRSMTPPAVPAPPPIDGGTPGPPPPATSPQPRALPAPEASSIPVLPSGEASSFAHRVIASVRGRTCTARLGKPVNTGDPAANPAQTLALQRLLAEAANKGADAVTNVKCHREIVIGLKCPAAVACEGDAIAFGQPLPDQTRLTF